MSIFQALTKALRDVFTPRMLFAPLLPALLWAGLLIWIGWWSWDNLMLWLQEPLQQFELPVWLMTLGRWVTPLVLMWLSLPLMVLGALLLANFIVTPWVTRYLARRDYGDVARRGDVSVLGSLGWALTQLVWAILLWLISLPLQAIPPLGWLAHVAIWGWLSYRLLALDVLTDYATATERDALLDQHRQALWGIGLATGLASSVPIVLWFLSPFALLLSPLVAFISIWMQLLLFTFVSLWFGHYLLAALRRARQEPVDVTARPMSA